MFKWSPFPFLRFSLALASGILLSRYFPALWANSFAAVYLLLFLFVLVWVLGKRSFVERSLSVGLIASLLLVYLGGLLHKLDEDRRWSSHYTQFTEVSAFTAQVMGDIHQTASGWRFAAEVEEVLSRDTSQLASGRAQVFVRGLFAAPDIGDRFYGNGHFQPFRKPGNPGQFDYGLYMRGENIYAQVFLDGSEYKWVDAEGSSGINAFAHNLRQDIIDDLHRYFRDSEATQIALALLLGVKDDLSDDLRASYAAAGATHVLAVSGLHVGIVYLLLLWILGGLRKLKYGKPLFVGSVVLCIWLYAMVTGMSASVFRSATMFTILALGEASGNDRNIFNTLGIAAFVLLLYQPTYLFDLGFQFSYLAVFGIVYLFPKFYNLWVPPNRLSTQVWSVTCVSLSAQLAVAPLSIYYFHQFPTYFLLTNLIVVVFAFLILLMGLPMIVLGSVVPTVGEWIAFPLELLIVLLNWLIRGIEALPGSSLTGMSISMPQVLLLYGFLVALLWSFQYRRFMAFALALVLFVGFMVIGFSQMMTREERKALVIYDVRDAFAMDLQHLGQAILVSDSINLEDVQRNIDPARLQWHYRLASDGWRALKEAMLCDSTWCAMTWEDQRILRLHGDLAGWQVSDTIHTDVLVISNNAKIPEKSWSMLRYGNLVLDGTNDYWYVRRIESARFSQDISPHFVREDGFWQLIL